MKKISFVLFIILCGSLYGENTERETEVFWYNGVAGGANYIGLQYSTRLYARMPIVYENAPSSPVFNAFFGSAKVDFGIRNDLSPSYEYPQLFMSIEPIAVFDLYISVGMQGYLPAVGFLTGATLIDDSTRPLDGDRQDLYYSKNTNQAALCIKVAPTLKMAIPKTPILIMNTTEICYRNIYRDTLYYDSVYNVNITNGDVIFVNDTYLMFQTTDFLRLGILHHFMSVPKSDMYGKDEGYKQNGLFAAGTLDFNNLGKKERLSFSAALLSGIWLRDYSLQVGNVESGVILGGVRIAGSVSLVYKVR